MGQYDDISSAELRADLVLFAELVLRLQEDDGLLVSPADLQKILGELRQKLFAWEIRRSRHLGDAGSSEVRGDATASGAGEDTSLRVVREALERQERMIQEWSGDADPESND